MSSRRRELVQAGDQPLNEGRSANGERTVLSLANGRLGSSSPDPDRVVLTAVLAIRNSRMMGKAETWYRLADLQGRTYQSIVKVGRICVDFLPVIEIVQLGEPAGGAGQQEANSWLKHSSRQAR